jgi:(S)-ureidoglycine aminohydrolase
MVHLTPAKFKQDDKMTMNVFGSTRSRVRRDHALIAPDSFVRSPLPGWDNTEGVILISPQLGARFTQYLALMGPGASAGPAPAGIERVIFVLEGEVTLKAGREPEHALTTGGYAFFPPDADVQLRAKTASRLNVFEKRYVPLFGVAPPRWLFGQEQAIDGVPFLGDPDALLKTLLPQEPAFDLAVNVFTFRPGATLPMVEVHVMEHGLLMLQGQGVYRLADAWYPVREGDVIWMAPYCPQWFVAMGKGPARYLYYKDVNRDPMQSWA